MIPIIYDSDETAFVNNGLGRLRDCISCKVTEERNGIYECDFEYPASGANYDLIQLGRIIAVTHDDTGDIQPFDIVSVEKTIDGIATFHCTHISYRLNTYTIRYSGVIHGTPNAGTVLREYCYPTAPFNFKFTPHKYAVAACADGLPHSARQMLGGMEGSFLDAFGGEYEWDRWNVTLWTEGRGQARDFAIRYGVNMTGYQDQLDISNAYSSCVPFWSNGDQKVIGPRTVGTNKTVTGRGECVPLDLSSKFEEKPTVAQLQTEARAYMNANQTYLPAQTIEVSFARLEDMGDYASLARLNQCQLCDTIKVIFPEYNTEGRFKIVKTVWDVLGKRFDEMELGSLQTTLSEALGVSQSTPEKESVLTGIYKVTTVTVSVPATAAHGNVGGATYSMTAQDGYTAVGIVGWSTGNYRIRPTTHYIDSDTELYSGFANTSADATTRAYNVVFRVLWIKTAA